MKEYDDATLKRLQAVELMIFNDFQKICKKYDIQYFGLAGTEIGAIRHQGFIPWDDDIDIGMLRDDYEKFLKAAVAEMGDKYIVMNYKTDENFPLMTTRWTLRGTKFREEPLKDVNCELGIFLDLYPFDQASDDEKEFQKQSNIAWFLTHLMMVRSIPFPILPMDGWQGKLVHACTASAYGVMSLAHVSKYWLAEKAEEAARKANSGPKTRRVSFYFDTKPAIAVFDYDELFPLDEMPFENVTMTFPKEQDRYLRSFFGDYMQLPPEDKRKNHCPEELDFGIYGNIPLEDLRNPDLYIDPKDYQ